MRTARAARADSPAALGIGFAAFSTSPSLREIRCVVYDSCPLPRCWWCCCCCGCVCGFLNATNAFGKPTPRWLSMTSKSHFKHFNLSQRLMLLLHFNCCSCNVCCFLNPFLNELSLYVLCLLYKTIELGGVRVKNRSPDYKSRILSRLINGNLTVMKKSKFMKCRKTERQPYDNLYKYIF